MSWQVHYLFFSKIGIALFNVIRFICRIIFFSNLLSHDTINLGFFHWNSVVISSILVKEQVWYSLVIIILVRVFGIETKLVKQSASALKRDKFQWCQIGNFIAQVTLFYLQFATSRQPHIFECWVRGYFYFIVTISNLSVISSYQTLWRVKPDPIVKPAALGRCLETITLDVCIWARIDICEWC